MECITNREVVLLCIFKESFNLNTMKLLILGTFFILTIATTKAQKIYSVDKDYKADIKVFVVSSDYKADLLVYKVSSDYKAGDNDGKWFFTKAHYKADKKIYFVEVAYKADLKIYFVASAYKAGWKNKSKMHLMY